MPSETDENGELYFYFGWENINGGWLVRRQLRSNGDTVDAIPSNNSSHADLTGAWLARETLTYDV